MSEKSAPSLILTLISFRPVFKSELLDLPPPPPPADKLVPVYEDVQLRLSLYFVDLANI